MGTWGRAAGAGAFASGAGAAVALVAESLVFVGFFAPEVLQNWHRLAAKKSPSSETGFIVVLYYICSAGKGKKSGENGAILIFGLKRLVPLDNCIDTFAASGALCFTFPQTA